MTPNLDVVLRWMSMDGYLLWMCGSLNSAACKEHLSFANEFSTIWCCVVISCLVSLSFSRFLSISPFNVAIGCKMMLSREYDVRHNFVRFSTWRFVFFSSFIRVLCIVNDELLILINIWWMRCHQLNSNKKSSISCVLVCGSGYVFTVQFSVAMDELANRVNERNEKIENTRRRTSTDTQQHLMNDPLFWTEKLWAMQQPTYSI